MNKLVGSFFRMNELDHLSGKFIHVRQHRFFFNWLYGSSFYMDHPDSVMALNNLRKSFVVPTGKNIDFISEFCQCFGKFVYIYILSTTVYAAQCCEWRSVF